MVMWLLDIVAWCLNNGHVSLRNLWDLYQVSKLYIDFMLDNIIISN